MTLEFSLPAGTPSQAEIDAAIRRAHRERAEAFRRILGSLFTPSKGVGAPPEPAADLNTGACR